jgi:hypothetical protein
MINPNSTTYPERWPVPVREMLSHLRDTQIQDLIAIGRSPLVRRDAAPIERAAPRLVNMRRASTVAREYLDDFAKRVRTNGLHHLRRQGIASYAPIDQPCVQFFQWLVSTSYRSERIPLFSSVRGEPDGMAAVLEGVRLVDQDGGREQQYWTIVLGDVIGTLVWRYQVGSSRSGEKTSVLRESAGRLGYVLDQTWVREFVASGRGKLRELGGETPSAQPR